MSPGNPSPRLINFLKVLIEDYLSPRQFSNLLNASTCTLAPEYLDSVGSEARYRAEQTAGLLATSPEEELSFHKTDIPEVDRMTESLAQKVNKGYTVNVILVNMSLWDKMKTTPFIDIDRETERRLLSIGVLGYLSGKTIILNHQVPADTGFVLV